MPDTRGSILTLPLPTDFHLPTVVCSYGYYVLAPNKWDPEQATLDRPLLLDTGKRIDTRTTQRGRSLRITCNAKLARSEQHEVKERITRMLRIDEDLRAWYASHREAKSKRWGRLFRSPTLFEDIIKTMTGCNTTWGNTKMMNRLLCDILGGGVFPSIATLAKATPKQLKACKLGYRADWIKTFAQQVQCGEIGLTHLEQATAVRGQQPAPDTDTLYKTLRTIKGIGDYAAKNILQHLGHYDHLPIDSETYRHYCERQNIDRPANPATLNKAIETHYEPYRPHRFLAYWYELWFDYEWANSDEPQT